MHIKSQINKTTIYFCSRCYGYLTMDVKFKNRKKDLGGVSKLKQQVQRYAFCLHSKWCSEVKGHTCTRLHQEVGRRRQGGGKDCRIAGREVTVRSPGRGRSPVQCGTVSLRLTKPWCSSCTPRYLMSPRPARNHTHVQSAGTRWSMGGANVQNIAEVSQAALNLASRKATWTDQSIG